MTGQAKDQTQPPSLAGADWLAGAETQAVFAAIAAGGYSARVVGGAIRNALLGRPVKDVDFATTATPEVVLTLAAAAGLGAVPTGIAHGTITVIAGHVPFEVTTLRHDVETFGRHARVAFTQDWAADARRRDFTFNALYCDAAGTVLDPLGGYGDLLARHVRFIGDPVARIREDYLRILRYFRFHAEYGSGAFDKTSLAACTAERDGLRQLSGERVRAELVRLLTAPGVLDSVQAMQRAGILAIVLGAAGDVATLERLRTIEVGLDRPPDAVLGLTALAASGAIGLKSRLRLSAEEAGRIDRLQQPIAGLGLAMAEPAAKSAIYRAGAPAFIDALLLAWAKCADAADDPGWRRLLTLATSWPPPTLPVRGADILARGVSPGPAVGRMLVEMEAWWIGAGFPDDAALIAARLDEIVRGEQ